MKYLVLTDIHGSSKYLKQVLNKVEDYDQIIILGDILYHGPRNDLPKDYNPKAVIKMLNDMKEEILCVRGNCDTEVDQMVLEFPIMAEYCVLFEKGRMIFVTHGHTFNMKNQPMLKEGDILLHGHTHIPAKEIFDGKFYLNPGSVSIPKEGSEHSYMMYEDGLFTWKELDGQIYDRFAIDTIEGEDK
jgi:putative phosphoesterase